MSEVVENAFVRLDPLDNIVVCVKPLKQGQTVSHAEGLITLQSDIQVGHKLCITPIAAGGKVIKHGASIGSAVEAIAIGQHVHTHNMKSDYIASNVRKDSGA